MNWFELAAFTGSTGITYLGLWWRWRPKFDCDKGRHPWGRVEEGPASGRTYIQVRRCERCNIKQSWYSQEGRWVVAVGAKTSK
jgi:hypothetical protein